MAKHAGTGNAVDWFGIDQVLNGYDLHTDGLEHVYFSVWQGNVPKFTYDGGDITEGRDMLEKHLQPLIYNQSTAMYTLRFHPNPGDKEITNGSLVSGSGNFKMTQPDGRYMAGVQQQTSIDNSPLLQKMMELLQAQDQRLQKLELEQEIEESEEPEDDEEDNGLGAALAGVRKLENTIAESPLLSGLYADARMLLHGVAKKWGLPLNNTFSNQEAYASQNIAGVGDQQTQQQPDGNSKVDMTKVMQELEAAFPELRQVLIKLHAVSQQNPDYFQMVRKTIVNQVSML